MVKGVVQEVVWWHFVEFGSHRRLFWMDGIDKEQNGCEVMGFRFTRYEMTRCGGGGGLRRSWDCGCSNANLYLRV